MTREELLALVNGKLSGVKLTLSEKTINEELDDVLEDFGEDSEANDKLVEKIANRLKRMDGNLHADVSQQVKDYKKKAKERQAKQNKDDNPDDGPDDEPDEEKIPKYLKKFMDDFYSDRDERKQKEATDAKNALIDSVKKGLKAKFEKAGLEINGFFAKTALSRLEIPEENADVASLVARAEVLYNEDIKAAGYVPDSKPHSGGGGGSNDTIDEHEFDDVAASVALRRPKKAE